MNWLINALTKLGLLNEDLDYHLIRASMVLFFLFFGYQKWFEYEAQVLIPDISNGPLISWMYPMFGIRGASWFLGALGSCGAFLGTVTIIPFMPDGWAAMQDGKHITTIEGLERDGTLHPIQAAFIEHDGFQCGFCTSGQIMSAVAMIEEAKAGWPSAATTDVGRPFTIADLSAAEIRERMSGNLCRCACYPNIVDAVAEAAARS